jgi:hypothetical protein
MIASGDPKKLRKESDNPTVQQFLTRGMSDTEEKHKINKF